MNKEEGKIKNLLIQAIQKKDIKEINNIRVKNPYISDPRIITSALEIQDIEVIKAVCKHMYKHISFYGCYNCYDFVSGYKKLGKLTDMEHMDFVKLFYNISCIKNPYCGNRMVYCSNHVKIIYLLINEHDLNIFLNNKPFWIQLFNKEYILNNHTEVMKSIIGRGDLQNYLKNNDCTLLEMFFRDHSVKFYIDFL